MGQLVVVRHGQASLMKAEYDELSEHGRAQARALGVCFAAQGPTFDAVYTGPARRQRDTAALAGEVVRERGGAWPEAVLLPELDEHDAFARLRAAGSQLGHEPEIAEGQRAWLGADTPAERSRSFQQLYELVMHRWMQGRFEPEAVESWPRFRGRVLAGLERILAAGSGRTVAFSSVGPLAVLLQRALGTDDAASFRTAWRIRNASMTTFVFDGAGRFTLDAFNALPHLPDPSAWTFR
jgi:broad specificity phosphatase PhoE